MVSKRLNLPAWARAAFQDRLRAVLNEKGLSLAEAVQRASRHMPDGDVLTRASLRHYLQGRSLPRLRYLHALARGLGVNSSDLIAPLDWPKLHDPSGQRGGTLRVEGHGDAAHLWVEQRVPREVAMEILELLGAPANAQTRPAMSRTGLEKSGAEAPVTGDNPPARSKNCLE